MWKNITSPEIIDSLIPIQNKCVFLAGAGISIDPPSALPTGHQFTKTMLNRLIPSEEVDNIVELMNPEREGLRNSGDFLRFEQLIEFIHEIDPDYSILKIYEDYNQPNLNHLALASFIIKGHDVFTTNIDSLLEYGLLNLGIAQKYIYPVITKKDFESKINKKESPVFKLHGSMIDVRSEKRIVESLKVTLTQINQAVDEEFTMESWERNKLEESLTKNPIIIMGYSGLDDFDIIPTIKTIKTDQPLIWITHDHNRSIENSEILELLPDDSDNTETVISDDRVSKLLYSLSENDPGSRRIIRIFGNTTKILEKLAKRINIEIKINENIVPEDNFNKLKQSAKNLSFDKSYPSFLTAEIYNYFNYQDLALKNYQESLRVSQELNNQKKIALSLNGIGLLLRKKGDLEGALEHHKRALEIHVQLTDPKNKKSGRTPERAKTLNNLALVYEDQGLDEKALEYYVESLEILHELGYIAQIAIGFNNISYLFAHMGAIDEAIEYYEKALDFHNRSGALRYKVDTLNNYADLLDKEGDLEKALDLYNQAIKISDQLGVIVEKAHRLNAVGLILEELGQPEEALNSYKEALSSAEQEGDLDAKASSFSYIASILNKFDQSDTAIEYYLQALKINKQQENLKKIGTTLNNLGLIYKNQGDLEKALSYYQKALDIANQLEDLSGQATNLNNIGMVYKTQKKFDKALDYYSKSFKIVQQSDDKFGQARSYNNLGTILLEIGKIDDAIRYFNSASTLAIELDNDQLNVTSMVNLGVAYEMNNKHKLARNCFKEALPIAKKLFMNNIINFLNDKLGI